MTKKPLKSSDTTLIKEKKMEEYINSIRSNAMTVNELITFLRQFDGASTIGISTDIGQIDIYKDENGDLIFR